MPPGLSSLSAPIFLGIYLFFGRGMRVLRGISQIQIALRADMSIFVPNKKFDSAMFGIVLIHRKLIPKLIYLPQVPFIVMSSLI